MLKCAVLAFLFTIAPSVSAFEQDEPVIPVSLCELKANPEAYDHKRIAVQGTVSHEFEDFTLHDLNCADSKNTVWLTYGAGAADDIAYCCGRTGNETGPVRVEGFDVVAVQDGNLKRVRELLNSYRISPRSRTNYLQTNPSYAVKATLRGRFFAGREAPGIPGRRGYGHMGCCTLLAIEQVLSIDRVDSNIKRGEKDCRTDSAPIGAIDRGSLIDADPLLMRSDEKWRTTDRRRVAEEALDTFVKTFPPAGTLRFENCRKQPLTNGDPYACSWSSQSSALTDTYRVELFKPIVIKTARDSRNDAAWRATEVSRARCEQH